MELAISFDLGGTFLKFGLIDSGGEIVKKGQIRTPEQQEDILKLCLNSIEDLHKEGLQKGEVKGISLGIPGWVNSSNFFVSLAPNLGWKNVSMRDFKREVAEKFNLNLYIENDANLAAVGEKWQGAGKGKKDFLFITLGTGIGSGLILGNELYKGYNNFGMEIGHLGTSEGDSKCGCGSYGCLETKASATAILKEARKRIAKSKKDLRLEELTVKDIFALAEGGEQELEGIIRKAMSFLAKAIRDIALIIDVPLVIIGGGVSQNGTYLLNLLQTEVEKCFGELPQKPPSLKLATLKNDAGFLGGAKIVFDH